MIRDYVQLAFDTTKNKVRSISVPDPRPLAQLQPLVISQAAAGFMGSNIFDANSDSGSISGLARAVHVSVDTVELF